MRVTPSKVLNLVTALVLLILLYTVFTQTRHRSAGRRQASHTRTCDLSVAYRTNLHRLVHATHKVLDGLELTHFLGYGSLFGQIRRSESLPWEADAEMGLLNEQVSRYDEVFLKRAFWKQGMDLVYDSAEGRYVVSAKKLEPNMKGGHIDRDGQNADSSNNDGANSKWDVDFDGELELIVFAKDKDIKQIGEPMYHRVGWKRRLLPPDCEYSPGLQCFPSRLIQAPLPLKLFGQHLAPVPREEFEMLKYHFPDSWWREEKPLNC